MDTFIYAIWTYGLGGSFTERFILKLSIFVKWLPAQLAVVIITLRQKKATDIKSLQTNHWRKNGLLPWSGNRHMISELVPGTKPKFDLKDGVVPSIFTFSIERKRRSKLLKYLKNNFIFEFFILTLPWMQVFMLVAFLF